MSDIRDSSKGEDYPYTVVGTIVGGNTLYYVVNIETGARDFMLHRTSKEAHKLAHMMSEGKVRVVT